MKKFKHLWLAGLLLAATVGFTSCDDDDDNATSANPAEEFVTKNKKHDTAILLCTFGSTFKNLSRPTIRRWQISKRHFLMQTSIWLLHLTPV